MMSKLLTEKLGLHHENSTPYYPQANDQVEVINKVLITMLRQMIGIHKTSWHTMLFSVVGLSDIRQVCYHVYTFSVSLWCGSHSPY